ncbi:putative tyrosine-protein kinase Wsck [Neodiprion virginianus]|uniref:putative tyrosine-protein kinase Wsck n=1 Tax=Neodiprion virginianus TaxID=2961670 RepID=UPI001EE6FC90|nr:putative tyrosine-protein kinase Wsck [Neodiprion virginianus]
MILLWILTSVLGGITFAQEAYEYKGCYRNLEADVDFPVLAVNHPSSPSECIRECGSRYYMFAGLMNDQQCYCGSEYGRSGPSLGCTIYCVAEPTALCGSLDSVSVYSTGLKGPSPPRHIQLIRSEPGALQITWEPPNVPNGKLIAYNLRAVSLTSHASGFLPTIEIQVQGGSSNTTTMRGLQPGTNYNVSIVAVNTHGSGSAAYSTNWTLIGQPDKPDPPKIVNKTDTTVTVVLAKGSSESGPVSRYQVVVVRAGTIPPTDSDRTYPGYEQSREEGLGYYVTGEFEAGDYERYKTFTIGDGRRNGRFYNAPLDTRSSMPHIGLIVTSEIRDEKKYSYSELTNTVSAGLEAPKPRGASATVVVLYVAIVLLGVLLLASVLTYVVLRRRHARSRAKQSSEQQELTLQGPVCEVDNMAYVPEDVPERKNHYQDLKSKVWSIPKNFLVIDAAVVRRGRFGTVHMGTVQINGVPKTATVHTISDGLLRASEKKAMLRELDVCIRVGSHINLAGLIGTCETPESLYVVIEMPPQTLKNRLLAARSGDPLPPNQILSVGVSVASALLHLQNHKIVHTCLCARSVGLESDGTPKLMGHGIAKYALEDIKYIRWKALELLNNEKWHQEGVVWAFGVLLWEIFSMGGTPYADLVGDDEVEDAVRRHVRLPQLRDMPDPFYEVMLSCWSINRDERPTLDELVRIDTLSVCPITSVTEPYIPELELN